MATDRYDKRKDIEEAEATRSVPSRTSELQADLWTALRETAAGNPTPLVALVVAGMNDVFKVQGESQAADLNRIPAAARLLMASIALCSTMLLGYRARRSRWLALVLPLVVSISLLLIADIDAPRRGFIHVNPGFWDRVCTGAVLNERISATDTRDSTGRIFGAIPNPNRLSMRSHTVPSDDRPDRTEGNLVTL